MTKTIKADLKLTSVEVANSNIISLVATLLIRFIAGPLCDQFGPRRVFGSILLVGAIPLGLAPLIQSANGLYASRFFIGILGSSFVPCLVWTTAFFDKSIVGTANALAGGWGNAGGGVTYFIMPAILDSLVSSGHSEDQAWRLTFVVPLITVLAVGAAVLLICPDTPTGKWSKQHLHTKEIQLDSITSEGASSKYTQGEEAKSEDEVKGEVEAKKKNRRGETVDNVIPTSKEIEIAKGEIIQKPSFEEVIRIVFNAQTLFHVLSYMSLFGAELAIDAILGAYYLKNFPALGVTTASNWAAMFGFLNFVTRPLGGLVADLLYNSTGHNLWAKKAWILVCGLTTGVLLIIIGQVNSHDEATMFGLVGLMAIFLEAGNGANFALIPHVHPQANGVISGITGAGGNLGGVVFSVVFRFMDGGVDYAKGFWVMGIIILGLNLSLSWVRPIPRGQVGGK